jgi:hypothetical protein
MVDASLSSVSLWVRDVELSSASLAALRARNPAHNGEIVREANLARARARRLRWQAHGRRLARRGDPLHLAGCMLYWAEGSKSRSELQFSNSDPAMVSLFVEFLRCCYGAEERAICLRLSLFADHEQREHAIEDFWLAATGLPRSSLRRSVVNRYPASSKRRRVNKLPYGTCRVTLYRAAVVQSIYGAIQEYGSFKRPEWVG